MSIDEAGECARRIIDLYGDMVRFTFSAQDTLALQMEDKTSVVAPILVKTN
jgi:hypothetical protein